MAQINFVKGSAASITTPAAGKVALFVDATSGIPSYKDESGAVHTLQGADGSNGLAGINSQTGTAYTLVLSDRAKDIRCSNASPVAITVPPASAVAFPLGSIILFSQDGAGAVSAVAGAGVTLRAPNGVATTAQYDFRALELIGADEWRVC